MKGGAISPHRRGCVPRLFPLPLYRAYDQSRFTEPGNCRISPLKLRNSSSAPGKGQCLRAHARASSGSSQHQNYDDPPPMQGTGRSNKFRRRPTLPGSCPPSTIGAIRLDFSVRNGKRYDPDAITTGNFAEASAIVGAHIPKCMHAPELEYPRVGWGRRASSAYKAKPSNPHNGSYQNGVSTHLMAFTTCTSRFSTCQGSKLSRQISAKQWCTSSSNERLVLLC